LALIIEQTKRTKSQPRGRESLAQTPIERDLGPLQSSGENAWKPKRLVEKSGLRVKDVGLLPGEIHIKEASRMITAKLNEVRPSIH
jgi:hypothetical protein